MRDKGEKEKDRYERVSPNSRRSIRVGNGDASYYKLEEMAFLYLAFRSIPAADAKRPRIRALFNTLTALDAAVNRVCGGTERPC